MNTRLIIAVLLISLFSFTLQWWQPEFIYNRNSVSQGEWWRVLSGQIVHTNWPHFALNISSLILFTLLFYSSINAKTFTISLCLLMSFVGTCLHLFEPRLQWYAGLSGAIYGIYLIGAYTAHLAKETLFAISIALLIIGKVLFDHYYGPAFDNSALIEARVVTESHLYGVLGAMLFCGMNMIIQPLMASSNS